MTKFSIQIFTKRQIHDFSMWNSRHELLIILFYFTTGLTIFAALDLQNVKTSTSKQLTYVINEESEIGTFIGNLKLDIERKYFIPHDRLDNFELYDDSKEGYFRVDKESGKLFVASRIDREGICPRPETTPASFSLGNDKISSAFASPSNFRHHSQNTDCVLYLALLFGGEYWVNILITVHDINDHQPSFSDYDTSNRECAYLVNVSESVPVGYEVPLIGAKDPDLGLNSVQSYSLRGDQFDPNRFSVSYQKPFNLNLMILDDLDAERQTLYRGELIACDAGQPIPKCGNQSICIQVTDLNDNRPAFDQTVYEIDLNETLVPQSVVIKLRATDADSGKNGQVRYRYGQPVSKDVLVHFTLNPLTGIILSKTILNAKEKSQFIIPIVAEDGGNIPLVGKTVVRVQVRDINDHAPWIQARSVRDHQSLEKTNLLVIEENEPAGTHIGLIISGDEDLGQNSEVTCALKNPNQPFYIEHVNSANSGREIYRLISNQTFDRETVIGGFIYVNIICYDKGEIRRTTEESIPIGIIDVNEFKPSFTKNILSMLVEIEEGLPVGTYVMKAEATDMDAEPSIRYHLSREAQSYFHINPTSGIVTSRIILDRESTPSIRFNVYVTDNQSITNDLPDSVMNVTVIVNDINDNFPELTNKQRFAIVENRPSFSDLVGQVTAIDKDAGLNGTVRFKILSVVEQQDDRFINDTFMINEETGKIFALRSLDREHCSHYRLTILLFDLGIPLSRNTTEQVDIEILDENDSRPIWTNLLPLISASTYSSENQLYPQSFKLRTAEQVHELGILNLTGHMYNGQRICKFVVNDYDTLPNANLSFDIIDEYISPIDILTSTRKLPKDSPYFDTVKNELLISQTAHLSETPSEGIMLEIYLRVTDNGHPELESVGRLFIHISANINRATIQAENQGFLFFIQSTGKLGVISTVVLIFVMCLTSLCLVVAFVSLKPPRSSSHCFGCCALRTDETKSNPVDGNLTRINFHPHLIVDDDTLRFSDFAEGDNSLGTMYQTSKLNSIIPDDASLYKWQSGIPISSEFGPSPMYSLTLLDPASTVDEHVLHDTSITTSGGSGISLVPLTDRNCASNCGAPIMMNRHFSAMSPMRAHVHNPTAGSDLKESTRSDASQATNSEHTEYPSNKLSQTRNKEVDGASADSGQGASEDEPGLIDAWRFHSTTIPEESAHPSISIPMRVQITGHPSSTSLRNTITNKSYQNRALMTTFSNGPQTIHYTDSSHPQIVPPPKWDTAPSRWRRPILDNGGNDLIIDEYGHSNSLFEECGINTLHVLPRNNQSTASTQPPSSMECKLASKIQTAH